MAWVEYNPNPLGKRTGDCTVRAFAKAMGLDWDTAYLWIALEGFVQKSMPSINDVWGMALWRKYFQPYLLPGPCPWCYTVRAFAEEHPVGTFVLCTGNHVVTCVDGDWWDSWDSGDEVITYCFVKEDQSNGME